MILDRTRALTFELTAAKTTNDFEITVDYFDWNNENIQTAPGTQVSVSSGASEVIILSAPVQNPKREPKKVTCYNADTVDKTAIIKTDDGTTETTEIRILVPTLKALIWSPMTDWYVTT